MDQQQADEAAFMAAFRQLQQDVQTLSAQNAAQAQALQAATNAAQQAQTTATTAANAARNGLQIGIKPNKPEPFKGDRNENIDAWIFQFEQYFGMTAIPQDQRVAFAASFLNGRAAAWWRIKYNEMVNLEVETDWDVFLQNLRRQFKSANSELIARQRIRNLKQTTSVEEYAFNFRALLNDLPDMHPNDALFQFQAGLKPDIALQVGMSNPLNLQEAERTAQNVDEIMFRHRQANHGRHFKQAHPSRTPSSSATPMELGNVQVAPLTADERERLRRDGICFRCRRGKHLARNCTAGNHTRISVNTIDSNEPDHEESGKEPSQ